MRTGQLKDVKDELREFRLVFERHWQPLWQLGAPSVYAGYADLRNENHFVGVSTTGAKAYRRSNARSYMPLGLKLTGQGLAANDQWSVAAEHLVVLSGQHTTRLTDVGATEDNTSKQTGSGWQLQASYRWQQWRITAYWRKWNMNATDSWRTQIGDVSYTFKEPANTTTINGVMLSYIF